MSTDPTSADPSGTLVKGRRLSEAEWKEAQTLYELGKANKTDLAERYGISRQSIREGLAKRGAVYGSKSKAIEDATIDAEKSDARKRVEDVQAMKEKQKRFIETTQGLAAKIMMDCLRENKPIGSQKTEIAVLKNMMAIFAAGRSELWEIYGLNEDTGADEEVPEFIVSEYTPEEIDQINARRLGDTTPDDVLASLDLDQAEGTDDVLQDLMDGGD